MENQINVKSTNLLLLSQQKREKKQETKQKIKLEQKSDTFEHTTDKANKPNKTGKKIAAKIVGISVASAIGGAVLTFIGVKYRLRYASRDLMEAYMAKADANALKDSAKTLIFEAEHRVEEAVESATKSLKDDVNSYKTKLDNLLKTDPKNPDATFNDKLVHNTREEINNFTLEYDPTMPPIKADAATQNNSSGIKLPEVHTPTQNRANMIELNIPKFIEGKKFEFEVPMTDSVKITKAKTKSFKNVQNKETTITADYADSVQWDKNKIARDILQNFFDGHGQTLDGVKLKFEPIINGKYKVKIEGKSTYTPDKAILLGESSKRDEVSAAGNYGEGLKMTVLKLLKNSGTEEVKIASDNWEVAYNLQNSSDYEKKVLTYSLNNTNKIDGNYIEFETSDKNLLSALRDSINRFYHSGNTDFKCPDFENQLFGIKKLAKGEKGSIYIAGQKFEFENQWEGMDELTVFFKEKPPAEFEYLKSSSEEAVFNPSRDRVSINKEDLKKIAKYFGANSKTAKTELANAINLLKPYWNEEGYNNSHGYKLLNGLVEAAYHKSVEIDFPKEYIVCSNSIDKLMEQTLKGNGYKLCRDFYFEFIGMQGLNKIIDSSKNHKVIAPSEKEIKKIGIIKKALTKFAPYLRNENYFPGEELNPKIYLFNKNSSAEGALNKSTLAEALTANRYTEGIGGFKASKGFWIDRNYINKGSFSKVLGTALHELTHKAGGDETSEFSYKLTDVLNEVLESRISDDVATAELKALRKIWDEIQ